MSGPAFDKDSKDLAEAYERISATRQYVLGKGLIDALAIAPGEAVLDIGCGTGMLAEYVADKVGGAGRVLGVDPLPLRIAVARARTRPNLAFEVADAYDLSALAPASFDVVYLNAVFHWLPEKTGPLREFARVLHQGGRLGIAGRAKLPLSPRQQRTAEILAGPPFGAYPRPIAGATHRTDESETRTLLAGAGFEVETFRIEEAKRSYPDVAALLDYSEASSFGNFLGYLPQDLRVAARETLIRELSAFAEKDGSVRDDDQRMIVVARKRGS